MKLEKNVNEKKTVRHYAVCSIGYNYTLCPNKNIPNIFDCKAKND